MKTLCGCLLAFAFTCALVDVPALAADTDAPECSKNHFILDDPADCWQETGALHVARSAHTATRLPDGRVLVAGGRGEEEGTSVEIYDPATGAWTLAAPLRVSRMGHTATLLPDGRVLVLGGHETYVPPPPWVPGTIPSQASATFVKDDTGEIYDPAADTWTSIPGPLTPRIDFTATLLLDGRVLVTGGDGDSGALDSCELYDPLSGVWTATGSFPRPGRFSLPGRYLHMATRLADGRVLVNGGYTAGYVDEVTISNADIYDPATGSWAPAGDMGTARGRHTSTLLADGRVLVTGGVVRWCIEGCGQHTLDTTELYDPGTNAWSAGPGMLGPLDMHSATLLDDGSIVLLGGERPSPHVPFDDALPADAETWTLSAESITPGASLRMPRAGHSATLLTDGSVLVVGGTGKPAGEFQVLKSAEIYHPRRASGP